MKNGISFFIILYLFSINALAQKNILKLGTITFGGTNYGVQYERSLSSHFSLVLQYGVVVAINSTSTVLFGAPTVLFGDGFYTEGRYYFKEDKDLMEGWHLGVTFNYINTTLEFDFDKNYLERYGIGSVAGYQWVFDHHITIDTLFGGGWMHTSTNLRDYHNGFFPLIGVNLGYNF